MLYIYMLYNETNYNKYWITKKDQKLIIKDFRPKLYNYSTQILFLLLIQLDFGI